MAERTGLAYIPQAAVASAKENPRIPPTDAPAADSADSVAKAVTTACATEVGFVTSDAYYAHLKSGMNDQLAKLVADGSQVKFADEAQRLVVEARAGHCAPPPLPSQPRSPDLRD